MRSSFHIVAVSCAAIVASLDGVAASETSSASGAEAKSECLLRSQMRTWKSSDDFRSIVIMISPGHGYRVDFGGECRGLRHATLTAKVSSSSNTTCVGPGDRIEFSGDAMGDVCVVHSVERLPPPPDASAP